MRNIFVFFIIVFGILSIGCRGTKQDKLIGKWEEIPYTNPDSAEYQKMWFFAAGDGLIIRREDNKTGEADSVEYTYVIDGDKLRIFDGEVWYNGEYEIDVLDKEYLKMIKKKDGAGETAWLRFEFAKR